ncbi:MAG: 4-hydroxythreonine-4-phosphate dehydrogenase PdxA [Marinicaulis sp.]|nr:4-hydroxythreonine-4-phosphate dehydrogenase PdxA [Marinicaulis sp.]NNL88803.1 4-hydroxythreonine-4-phosphate dehydrogenase PdxA [Marinicaulis sp.]
MTQLPSSIPPLALTMGEPGGVAPEITIKAWRALKDSGLAFFVIAPPSIFGQDAPINVIDETFNASATFKNSLPVYPLDNQVNATAGVAAQENSAAVIKSIERAVRLALDGRASAVVTNPIQKSALSSAGFQFQGHTEFLADLTKNAPMENKRARGPVMMLAGPDLKTVPVTIHQSVRDACASLTTPIITHTAKVVHEALIADFGLECPRLAISGLNPHAGEEGMMGMEDGLIIAPAVDELQARGFKVIGPLPADTMFHEEARAKYDAAICMLHDQALIPAKTLAFHDAVNVTLGLPTIRTSPDHGTALGIAGTGAARADSLIAAIKLAADMAAMRRRFS